MFCLIFIMAVENTQLKPLPREDLTLTQSHVAQRQPGNRFLGFSDGGGFRFEIMVLRVFQNFAESFLFSLMTLK